MRLELRQHLGQDYYVVLVKDGKERILSPLLPKKEAVKYVLWLYYHLSMAGT